MSVNQRYHNLVQSVMHNGYEAPSRFGDTIEEMNVQFTFEPGEILARRGQNLRIGLCETVQLIAGIWDGEAFKKYAPNSDNSLFTEAMAYGPRTVGLIPKILNELERNPSTREAWLPIGRPGEECSPNLPCTLGMQFLIRGDYRLYTNVAMRSLDLIKGLPVDVVMFGALSQMMANCLGTNLGSITITALSGHLYKQDLFDQKMPLKNGLERTFTMPVYMRHIDYVYWAIQAADWDWNSSPLGLDLYTSEREAKVSV